MFVYRKRSVAVNSYDHIYTQSGRGFKMPRPIRYSITISGALIQKGTCTIIAGFHNISWLNWDHYTTQYDLNNDLCGIVIPEVICDCFNSSIKATPLFRPPEGVILAFIVRVALMSAPEDNEELFSWR